MPQQVQEPRRFVYIKYMKDGQLFFPPLGLGYVITVSYSSRELEEMDISPDDHISAIVTATLINNGIRPEQFDITWTDEDPYLSRVN